MSHLLLNKNYYHPLIGISNTGILPLPEKLILLTDIKGILGNSNELISKISARLSPAFVLDHIEGSLGQYVER